MLKFKGKSHIIKKVKSSIYLLLVSFTILMIFLPSNTYAQSKDRAADDPGTNYWINRPKPPVVNGNAPGAKHLTNKIGRCIAYGLAGRRGPFGCNP